MKERFNNESKIFDEILSSIEEMERERKIDSSKIEKLDIPIEHLREYEDFWLTNEKIPIEDAFILYHTSRNLHLILEKIKSKFLSAVEKRENPKVAEDSLSILPMISNLYDALTSLWEEPLSKDVRLFLTRHLRTLRNTAAEISMLPSYEEEIKTVNIEDLKKEVEGFADTVKEMLDIED